MLCYINIWTLTENLFLVHIVDYFITNCRGLFKVSKSRVEYTRNQKLDTKYNIVKRTYAWKVYLAYI